jgi:acetyl-CoA carboxylase biotin carboxylase subunit
MIRKILIANRGEIALRIIRTAKKMGIRTVAVYSDADVYAPHTIAADEAYPIGGAASKDSYLNINKIIQVAKECKADAIHPGYGFLSENAEFAKTVEREKIIFIGPPASAMLQMGSKIEAKQIAKKMGVPLVPGTDKALKNIDEAKKIAGQTGYPVLIKASAGGGGKGMRIVEQESEFEQQLKMASSEALASFGDGSVFIEKYISKPRHIEIQILVDQFAHGIFLFERECSIQRRHQKIIEEAPSSCLTENTRNKMGQDALKLALSCGYVGAGTVEFLVDENMNYYFLEMNTRLQVEHCVTEMITGLDLVQLQIEIADGKKLDIKQDDLHINGHSIELRICAEDPANNFLPSIGTLTKYKIPEGSDFRLDDSYSEGMEIPIHYDPMIAKLIVHGKNRLDAIDKLKSAIVNFEIEGIETTLDFGLFVMEHKDFINGTIDTGFIAKYYADYLNSLHDPDEEEAAALIALYIYLGETKKLTTIIPSDNTWYNNRKRLN